MESGRVRALAAEALLQGASLGLFGATDVDFESRTIRYMRLSPDGWTEWQGPMPDVILQEEPLREAADDPVAARLGAFVPFANRPLSDRLPALESLQTSALASHVIPFRQVVESDAGEVIAAFLDEHQRIVLKPDSLHSRHRTAFIACDGDDIVVRQGDRRWRSPRETGIAELVGLVGDGRWIVQAMIVSRVRDGRIFDVRIHAHKDGSGRWVLVRSFVGLSEAGRLVSNLSRGGYQGDLSKVLAGLGDSGTALVARIRRLGLQIGEALDAQQDGGLGEIEIDILVDPRHWPWIAEVNTSPAADFHAFDRARFNVAYALYLARRHGEGRHREDGPESRAQPVYSV